VEWLDYYELTGRYDQLDDPDDIDLIFGGKFQCISMLIKRKESILSVCGFEVFDFWRSIMDEEGLIALGGFFLVFYENKIILIYSGFHRVSFRPCKEKLSKVFFGTDWKGLCGKRNTFLFAYIVERSLYKVSTVGEPDEREIENVLNRIFEDLIDAFLIFANVSSILQLSELVNNPLCVVDTDLFPDLFESECLGDASVRFQEFEQFLLLYIEWF